MMIIEFLKKQLQAAASFNPNIQVAPAAILWTDQDQQWQTAMPTIKQHLPQLVELGKYDPENRTGPAIWIKCVLAGLLDECILPADLTPIIYLPGVSRRDLRAIEQCPDHLKPLAELQYRGCWWTYNSSGRDWTVNSFLTNSQAGVSLDLAQDKKTQEVLLKVLPDLLETPSKQLEGKRLEADDFYALVVDDPAKDILAWLNHPQEKAVQWQGSRWDIFVQTCRADYQFDPEQTADAQQALLLLSEAEGNWATVWERFTDTAANLPQLVSHLQQIKPNSLAVSKPENYWSENEKDEQNIVSVLSACIDQGREQISDHLKALWQKQQNRKEWLWCRLGYSPWLGLLEGLLEVVEHTSVAFNASSPTTMAEHYTQRFWQADAAVMQIMAKAKEPQQQELIAQLLDRLYTPWLEETTLNFQRLVEAQGYPGDGQVKESTSRYQVASQVMFFVDGLRFDTAKQLEGKLAQYGLTIELSSRWAALPSLTATAKAAVTPLADQLTGLEDNDDFIPALADSHASFSSHHLKKLLQENRWQYLDGLETGDPNGHAWVQTGDLDNLGHDHQRKMPQFIDQVLNDVVARIRSLIDAGWQHIKIVTDHGWLWVPDGLPKAELHKSLGKNRQRRCAILKDNVQHNGLVMPWHWNPSVSVAMAPGISGFVAGDYYNHGGLSLQECLTPVLKVRPGAG